MPQLALSRPSTSLRDSYRGLVQEFLDRNEMLIPFPLNYANDDFASFIKRTENDHNGIEIPDGFVSNTTFWLVKNNTQVVGVSNLRHQLTEKLKIEGGHIGYGIRPSERQQGYGSEILRLTLIEAKRINILQTLITCDKDNPASAGVILSNGGVLKDEEYNETYGKVIQRYWISLR